MWVRYLPRPGDEPTEVGFAIGRRIGTAVVRNRLRRRLRAILTELDRAGELPPGVYLVGATPGAEQATFDELSEQMMRAIRRVTAEVQS